MKNILFSTIVRNRENRLGGWHEHLKGLVSNEKLKDLSFSLSIFENDSIDKSVEILRGFDYSFLEYVNLDIGNSLNTPFYGSVKNANRVKNLADARNKTLEKFDLNKFDYVICVEPDIIYNTDEYADLILWAIRKDYDIVSGNCFQHGIQYDSWCMRRTADDTDWTGPEAAGIMSVYSTFNGVCIYKAEPFTKGAAFSGVNARTGAADCDTAVICEEFHRLGYSKVFINANYKCYHQI